MAVCLSPGVALVVLWIGGFPHDFCGLLHFRLFHHVVGTQSTMFLKNLIP